MRGECGDIIVEDVVILIGRSGYEESTGIERRFDIMGFRIGDQSFENQRAGDGLVSPVPPQCKRHPQHSLPHR